MKYIFLLCAFSVILFSSCASEDEIKLEAFNPEVFAFDIGYEYEINASVRLKGFELKESGGKFNVPVDYEIDLIKPDNTSVKGILSNSETLSFDEEVKDAGLDIQFSLDSAYAAGEYTLVFNLKEPSTGKSTSISSKFNLE